MEELADDADTQGKRSARKWRLAVREESPNGGANQRLADSEWRCILTSVMGEKAMGKRKPQPASSFL
jgi:hypothetical protein